MEGVRCEQKGCGQHDFLPFTCSKCNKKYCLGHISPCHHDCIDTPQEAIKNDTANAPTIFQSIQSYIQGAWQNFDKPSPGSDDSVKSHYNIRSSKPPTDATNADTEKKLQKLEKVANESSSEKQKSISMKTKQILLKRHAIGNQNLEESDRYYVNVNFVASDQTVPMFFSYLSTIGDVLEYLTRQEPQRAFAAPFRPDHLSLCFQTPQKPWNTIDRKELLRECVEPFATVEILFEDIERVMEVQGTFDRRREQLRQDNAGSVDGVLKFESQVDGGGGDVSEGAMDAPCDPNHVYRKGDEVVYVASSGDTEPAVVTGVHLDDVPVYYTVRLLRADRERQTDASHLKPAARSSSPRGQGKIVSSKEVDQKTVSTSEKHNESGPGSGKQGTGSDKVGEISVRLACGNATFTLSGLSPDQTVAQLKEAVQRTTGVPANTMKLICKGTVLSDLHRLKQTKVSNGCKIVVFSGNQGSK